jgi:hypothetical protein
MLNTMFFQFINLDEPVPVQTTDDNTIIYMCRGWHMKVVFTSSIVLYGKQWSVATVTIPDLLSKGELEIKKISFY